MTNIGLDNVSNSMRHFSLKRKKTVSHFKMWKKKLIKSNYQKKKKKPF